MAAAVDSYTFNPSRLMPWADIKARVAASSSSSSSAPPRLALIASCGSYNPITTAHVQMVESAKRYLDGTLGAEEIALYPKADLPAAAGSDGASPVITLGAIISPVNDKYGKKDLAPFAHRKAACDVALAGSTWIAVDDWEGTRDQYERTFTVLSHIRREVRAHYAATAPTPEDALLANSIELYFLCGGDLFETFYRSGVWLLDLLEKIFREFRLLVVARTGSRDPRDTIDGHVEPLTHPSTPDAKLDLRLYRDRVHVVRIPENNTSSTRVREVLRSGGDLEGMVADGAAEYLVDNKVYV